MSLKLRFDNSENVIRSVGSPPNGIVCVREEDDGTVTFMVSPSWEPPAAEEAGSGQGAVHMGRNDEEQDSVAITPGEAVAAVADPETAGAVWAAAALTFQVGSQRYLPGHSVEGISAHLEFLVAVRNELAAAGYIAPVDGGSA